MFIAQSRIILWGIVNRELELKVSPAASTQNFGLKLPLGIKDKLWWKFIDAKIGGCGWKTREIATYLSEVGSPKTKLKNISFQINETASGERELFTQLSLRIGGVFNRKTDTASATRKVLGNIDTEHLKDSIKEIVEKTEKGYIKTRTYLAAGKRIKEKVALSKNDAFIRDLEKIDNVVPGYNGFKKKLYETITSAPDLVK